ncbi:MAG TPA: hypothetical protein VJ279_13570, partial [Hanamia sp.]|nr:hypothetical protein [Hanamia sp.]
QPSPQPVYKKRAGAPLSYVNSIKEQEFFPFDPAKTLQKYDDKELSDSKSRVERGQGSVTDLTLLSKKDPVYTSNLISTLAPEINPAIALSGEGLSQAIGLINEKKRNALGAQKAEQQREIDKKIESLLLSQNVIDEPINIAQLSADGLGGDASYANSLLDKADLRKSRELAELEVKYPKKRKLNEDIHLYVYSRDNPTAFNKEYHDIEEKYSNFAQLLGAKRASGLAQKDKSAAPSEIGMEAFRIADRDTYKTLKSTVGGSTGLERDIYQMGLEALYGAADNDGLYSLLAKDEKMADDLHPEKKSAEVYHKLGAVLHKDENWFANPKPSVAKLDAAAEQLDEEDRDFYYKHIRPLEGKMSGVTNVPMRGFANKAAGAIVSTAEETGKFIGDVTGVRSKSDRAFDALNEPFNTRNQNVGEHAPSVAELAQLNEKQKKTGLTPEETERKAELEKFTNIRSTFEDIIDGTGNLTGQVLFQAIATKGLGGLLTKGAKSIGVLKGEQLVDDFAGLEGFNGAMGTGNAIKIAASKELTTTIAADAGA